MNLLKNPLFFILSLFILTGCSSDTTSEPLSYNDVELSKEMYNYAKLETDLIQEIKYSQSYIDLYNYNLQNLESNLHSIQTILDNDGYKYPYTSLSHQEYDWVYLSDMSGYEMFGYYVYDFEDWFYEVHYSEIESNIIGCKITNEVINKMDDIYEEVDNSDLAYQAYMIKNESEELQNLFDENLRDWGITFSCLEYTYASSYSFFGE